MFELTEILIAALQEAGLAARSAMENPSASRVKGSLCTVALEESDVTDTAFGQYLGTVEDPEQGPLPLFGRRFRTEATLCCFAGEDLQACEEAVQKAMDVLLNLQGLRVQSFRLGALHWDDEACAYARTVTAQLQGMLYCLQLDDSETFTDFTLLPTII